MNELATYLIAAAISLSPAPEGTPVTQPVLPLPIQADCSRPRALEQAIASAAKLGGAEIRIVGSCVGNYLIATDGITLRGAFPGAGLVAADPARPVVEIADARAELRTLTIRNGAAGLFVHGRHAAARIVDVELSDHTVGVYADAGATIELIDSKLSSGLTGVELSDADGTLTRVNVSGHELAVSMLREGRIALDDCVIRDNNGAGLNVSNRGDATLLGTVFENNGQIHINANDYSTILVAQGTTLGAPGDTTWFALGANRRSTVSSFSTPEIYGGVSVLNRASISLGEAVLHGNLFVDLFSDAVVRNVAIEGLVVCSDRGEALCTGVTSEGNLGCAAGCGEPPAVAPQSAPPVYTPPQVERPLPSPPS